jgi:hypothetical protein
MVRGATERCRRLVLPALLATSVLVPAAPIAAQTPERVVVEPASVTLDVDESTQLSARALDGDGTALERARIGWLALDESVVAVDADGALTALRPGSTRVAAGVGNVLGFVEVTVAPLPAVELDATLPVEGALMAGTSAPLELAARTRLGDPAPVEDPRYRSADEAVARVDASGRVFARAPGRTTVTVDASGLETTVPVEVDEASAAFAPELTPAEARVRTGDVVRFSAGPGLYAGWAVSGSGASVEAEGTEGVFVAEAPGRYEVTAVIGENDVQTAVVDVEPRAYESELVLVGRGGIADHHSGDMWVFEGVDGRDYVYVGTFLHDWMKVWDVTDPAAPVLTDSMQLDARRINDVKIHPDNHLGIVTREGASSRRNGIVLLDLSTPAHPTILSEYTESVTGGVHNVWIDGERDLVYAAHNGTSEMHIIDISDPAAPHEVGRWGIDKRAKTLHDVIVQDGYAYLSYWDDGIVMLDVGAGSHGGTPTEPVEVSRFAYPIGSTHVAWRHGRYLFIGDELFPPGWDADRPIHTRGYIHVVDYDDPENPVEVARYEVPEAGAHNVWVEGDRLYVGYYQAGLRVVDISGELRGDLYAQGREVAHILTTDDETTTPNWPMAWGAQIFKGRIYSSDLNSGIWITRLEERPFVF